MSAIAAPRSGNPPPVSYVNAWWAVVQSLLVGLVIIILLGVVLMFVGVAAGLPLGVPGSSWTPLASLSDLVGWPFDPSLLWFRLVDLLALLTVTLWLGRRLRDRFLVIDVRLRLADAVMSVGGIMVIVAMSHWAGVVAVFVIAGLLRRADDSASPSSVHQVSRRWMATAWAVAILGSLVAINLVPVGAQAGSSCSVGGGSLQPPSGTTFGAGQAAIPYTFRHGGTFTACAVTQDRAWFTNATVLGVDASQLSTAPWRVTLVRGFGSGFGFRPIAPVKLTPRSSRDMFVLIRFTSCLPTMRGRTFTLATLPLRVHAYGRTQTDPVPLSQPVRTTCT